MNREAKFALRVSPPFASVVLPKSKGVPMEISLKQLEELLKTLEQGGASEFEYEDEQVRLKLTLARGAPTPDPAPPPPVASR